MSTPLSRRGEEMKTVNLEYTAEDLISHKLQRNGILVAKPKFDINGSDLIGFIDFNNSVKFGRIQCKGRTLLPNQKQYAKIYIPSEYVYDAFFVFIYFDVGIDNTDLYLFTADQIKQSWKINSKKEYYLNIRHAQLGKIKEYLFSDLKIENICHIIKSSKSRIEFLLVNIVKKQKEEIEIMKELHYLQKTVLEYENNKLIVEKCTLEIEKYQQELMIFIKEKVETLPNELIDEIKKRSSKNQNKYEIDEELREKCIKIIEKELIEDVVKYIMEET